MFPFTAVAAELTRPNLVFIYADDWGWGDLACHGHPELKTPNLDRLALEGTDFHQFTVGNPVCSPSRTAIMTGHYPARHGVHQHFAGHAENVARGMPDWLDPEVVVLPRLLQQAGYATAHFGKWHLSGQGQGINAPEPSVYGYDEAAVWTGPGRGVFEGSSVEQRTGDAHDDQASSFLTTAATDHAVAFIRSVKGQPFFLNLWVHETHHLVSATEQDKAAYPDTAEPQRTYYSAVTRADKQIGRVLDLLDELELAKNTLVIFSSDNGPENSQPEPEDKLYHSVGVTGGLRGQKRSLYLGGVNVPFIVRWPGHVPAGRVDLDSVMTGVDVMPTLLAAAGVTAPPDYRSDGMNLLPVWKGETLRRETPIFWEWRGPHSREADWPTHAVRDGDWVLLQNEDLTRVELYDVIADRAQQINVAAEQPERAAAMREKLDAWRATIPKFQQSPPPHQNRRPKPQAMETGAVPQDRSAIFTRWDTDASGTLSLEEYSAAIRTKDTAAKRFRSFDSDANGQISREEFVNP